ncbi:hypothetical protein MMSP_0421 [Mycobacterium sp. 012931]|nr:hypothetical protein MMSP_0421 [Mycobacterium sp. 012931]
MCSIGRSPKATRRHFPSVSWPGCWHCGKTRPAAHRCGRWWPAPPTIRRWQTG